MKILYIGGISNFKNHKLCETNSMSAEGLQQSILKGLEENNKQYYFINSPFKVKKYYKYNNSIQNLYFIKNPKNRYLSSLMRTYKILSVLNKNKLDFTHVMAYSLNLSFVLALKKIKKKNKNIITSIYVPDLPEYMNLENKKSFFYKIFKKIEIKMIERNLKFIDKYVFVTENMAEKLEITKENYIVIEGMMDSRDLTVNNSVESNSITYAGTLNYSYGINLLLEIIKLSDKDLKFNICGSGEAEKEIIELSKQYDNLTYHGTLNKNELINLLDKSTLLINPRGGGDEFSKYSFPSKTLDYMITGRPVLGFKLAGIPKEYDKYITYFNSENAHDCYKVLKRSILDISNLEKLGKQARNLLVEKKNPKFQVFRIIQFLNVKGEEIL